MWELFLQDLQMGLGIWIIGSIFWWLSILIIAMFKILF